MQSTWVPGSLSPASSWLCPERRLLVLSLRQPRCRVSVNSLFLAIEGNGWGGDESRAGSHPGLKLPSEKAKAHEGHTRHSCTWPEGARGTSMDVLFC